MENTAQTKTNENITTKELDVLAIGDSSIDLYMKIPDNAGLEETGKGTHTPKICFYHGSKIVVESFKTNIAGNAINVSVGLKLLGINTGVYTHLGNDSNAERIITELTDIGVDTRFCLKDENTETDLHTVIVFGGERTIFSYHGKRDYSLKNWGQPKIIYYTSVGENFEKLQEDLINILDNSPSTALAFNPGTLHMHAGVEKLQNILKRTAILFVNREEASKLTNTYDTNIANSENNKELHQKLQKLGPKLTIITDSGRGASGFDGTNFIEVPAYSDSRPIMDKTGAGDAFSARFLAAVLYNKPLKECLKWGTINSGSAIKVIGATHGLLKKEEIEKLL